MTGLLIFMLVATFKGEPVLQTDGDTAFWKVVNSAPAHALPAGVAAEMVNLMVDAERAAGRPRPRFGVKASGWGIPASAIPPGTRWGSPPVHGSSVYVTVNVTVGATYRYFQGNSLSLTTATQDVGLATIPGGTTIAPGRFTATQATYYLWGQQFNHSVTAQLVRVANTRGYGRFNDPKGIDNTVLVTDEARDDGGVGRAWRICADNAPQEIPLNGHDVWGPVKLVQCYNGLLLLRDGNERHYFDNAAIGTNIIQLNCLPAFADGDEVQIVGAEDGAAILGTAAPNLNAPYYVNNAGSNQIALYDTRAHAVAGGSTGKLLFDSGTASFYVERISTQAGFYGNGAPVLILQATDAQSAFEVGFTAVPTFVAIANTAAATDILTAENHRLAPGDAVVTTGTITGITAGTTYYARPVTNDTFQLYDTVDHALAGGATGLMDLTTDSQTGTVKKLNAGGQPIAPGRLGIAFLQRAILVNGRCNLLISDPNDPVHFTPMQATLNANLGENDSVVALMTAPYDTLIIIKSNNTVLALANLSQPNTSWLLYEVTREYGGVASLATANKGTERWFLSRRGVDRVRSSGTGNIQGVAMPVSGDIQNRFQAVDWLHISQACAESWNNRVFFALPLKGQTLTGGRLPANNGVLVYNTLARPPEYQGEDMPGGWEDLWQGASDASQNLLTPAAFSKLTINGEERLTFATADGFVCWFTDDFQDALAGGPAIPVATRLVTRGYFGGAAVLALKGEVNWDTFNPDLTVSVRTSGVNEQQTLLERTYDKTQYQVAKAGTYNPATATTTTFSAPHRADYAPGISELMVATLNTFQNTTEPLRMRLRDRAPQIIIENSQGAMMLNSVAIAGRAVQTLGTMT